jgi:16S rRNA (cytosine1402-N4)-methyltransferase
MTQPTKHISVLLHESVDALRPRPGGLYLDGTLGGGGHTAELLERSAPTGRVLSMDVDLGALVRGQERFVHQQERVRFAEANFRALDRVAAEVGMVPVDGILLDLGFSSDELADPKKGLSFQQDGPLDMRFGPYANEDGLTAAEIVNSWSEADLVKVLENFGEERHARRIAHGIVQARKAARIIGTLDLVAVIKKNAPPQRAEDIHPATRTFQALRMVVNDELEALKDAIRAAERVLAPEGRLAIITFHSLEDRVVKQAFEAAPWMPVMEKPITPTRDEISANPRARSAKLRVAERLSA